MSSFNDCIYVTNNNNLNRLNDQITANCKNEVQKFAKKERKVKYNECIKNNLHIEPLYQCRDFASDFKKHEICMTVKTEELIKSGRK